MGTRFPRRSPMTCIGFSRTRATRATIQGWWSLIMSLIKHHQTHQFSLTWTHSSWKWEQAWYGEASTSSASKWFVEKYRNDSKRMHCDSNDCFKMCTTSARRIQALILCWGCSFSTCLRSSGIVVVTCRNISWHVLTAVSHLESVIIIFSQCSWSTGILWVEHLHPIETYRDYLIMWLFHSMHPNISQFIWSSSPKGPNHHLFAEWSRKTETNKTGKPTVHTWIRPNPATSGMQGPSLNNAEYSACFFFDSLLLRFSAGFRISVPRRTIQASVEKALRWSMVIYNL